VNILAIDTTQGDLGIALRTADGRLYLQVQRAGLRHAETLAPAIESALTTAGLRARDLGLLICSLGPGSFTGVRIGMSTAKGIALGNRCPLVGVPSLDTLAFRLSVWAGVVLPVMDARKGRLYAALYRGGQRITDYLDVSPEDLVGRVGAIQGPVLITGPYAAAFGRLVGPAAIVDPLPAGTDPEALLALGLRRFESHGADPESLQPLYLRPSEAELDARS